MISRCAWCQRVLREGDGDTTNGICPACAKATLTGRLLAEDFAARLPGLRGVAWPK